jgi:hypothetical protein
MTSKVWEEAPHYVKERVAELCHVCVLVKCVPMQQVYYDKKLAKQVVQCGCEVAQSS